MFFYFYVLDEAFSLVSYRMTCQNSTINPDDQRGEDIYDNLFLELTATQNIIELDDRMPVLCSIEVFYLNMSEYIDGP